MKDIAKMREEMERKIRQAEMSNEIEEKVGIECTVMGESGTQKGKTWISFGEVTKEDATKILKAFPWTERSKTRSRNGEDIEISYILETHRYPKEWSTKLDIQWISGEWSISLKVPINEGDDVLMQYFKRDWYEIDDSTVGIYFGAVSPRDKENLKRQSMLSFNCGSVVRFYGGYNKQVSEGHAECIISEIIGE